MNTKNPYQPTDTGVFFCLFFGCNLIFKLALGHTAPRHVQVGHIDEQINGIFNPEQTKSIYQAVY